MAYWHVPLPFPLWNLGFFGEDAGDMTSFGLSRFSLVFASLNFSCYAALFAGGLFGDLVLVPIWAERLIGPASAEHLSSVGHFPNPICSGSGFAWNRMVATKSATTNGWKTICWRLAFDFSILVYRSLSVDQRPCPTRLNLLYAMLLIGFCRFACSAIDSVY
jgi:hypothetical protein